MTRISRLLIVFLVVGAVGAGLLAVPRLAGGDKIAVAPAYAAATAPPAGEAADSRVHAGDPFARVFLVLALLLICAMLGRFGAQKLKQSPVLGELAVGLIIGALAYQLAAPTVTILRHSDQVNIATQKVLHDNVVWKEAISRTLAEAKLSPEEKRQIEDATESPYFPQYLLLARILNFFSSFGVVLLLFMAGLETDLDQLKRSGRTVAGLGLVEVGLTFICCYLVVWLILPSGRDPTIPLVLAGALSATSVGISARVFKDMRKLGLREARIVLGAAVLDDILSLIILAVVTGILTTGAMSWSSIALIVLKAVLFFAAVAWLGSTFLKKGIAFFRLLAPGQVKLYFSFGLLLVLAWLADLLGLATIIGAFAAGLIIEDKSFESEKMSSEKEPPVESLLAPLEKVFAPLFFVLLGFQADVTAFANPRVLAVGLLLTLVAIFGKMAATVVLKKGYRKLIVGFGLVPRGEVTLIFASLGKSMGILSTSLYSVLIIVVLLTTLATPPLLKWSLERQ